MYIKAPLAVLLLSAIPFSLALPVTSTTVSARYASSLDARDMEACINKAKRTCDPAAEPDCINKAIRSCDQKEKRDESVGEVTCDQPDCIFPREETQPDRTCDHKDPCIFPGEQSESNRTCDGGRCIFEREESGSDRSCDAGRCIFDREESESDRSCDGGRCIFEREESESDRSCDGGRCIFEREETAEDRTCDPDDDCIFPEPPRQK